jgi:Holliday junction resolvase RusA-like endonuclease
MIRFTIPYPPQKKMKSAFCKRFGLNAYYSGKKWAERKRDAEELHIMAWAGMKKAHIRKEYVKFPVCVTFYWDDGLDVDNHAVLGKAFVDAMKGYILPDDNRRWLREVRHRFWDHGMIGVEITEAEPDREILNW